MLKDVVIRLFNEAIISDIHIEEGSPIWYREFGQLKAQSGELVTKTHIQLFLREITDIFPDDSSLANELDAKGDKDFSADLGAVRVRGNVFYINCGKLAVALRKLNSEIPSLEQLGLPDQFIELANRSKGLLLVTGATGSGKSTTLASMVERINTTKQRHIITVEDPIEYRFISAMSKVSQREIGKDAATFDLALRSALRQDPDVVMIGEMRDRVTVETALNAANTGHLVLATLHTMNARQSIERMVSFFSADEKEWAQQCISSVLLGVLSQVLVPKIDENERLLCYELLINSPGAKQCIKEGKSQTLYNIMETGRKEGHVLLNSNLLAQHRLGLISKEDASYSAYDPLSFEKELANDF